MLCNVKGEVMKIFSKPVRIRDSNEVQVLAIFGPFVFIFLIFRIS